MATTSAMTILKVAGSDSPSAAATFRTVTAAIRNPRSASGYEQDRDAVGKTVRRADTNCLHDDAGRGASPDRGSQGKRKA
jgi:hypothetical protein